MDENCVRGKGEVNGPGGEENESALNAAGSSPKNPFFYPVSALFFSLLLHGSMAAAAFLFHDSAVVSDVPSTVVALTVLAEDGPSARPPSSESSPVPTLEKHSEPPSSKAARPFLRTKTSPHPHTEHGEPAAQPASPPVPESEPAGAADVALAAPVASRPETEPGGSRSASDPADRPAAYHLGSADTPSPPYPMIARRKAQQGQVIVRLTVLPSGLVEKAELVKSSGVAALDRAALDTLRLWRLQPALRAGEPVVSRIEIPIKFVLE